MKHSKNLNYKENNLLIAIKSIEIQQDTTKGPTCWMAFEEELVDLRKRLGELRQAQASEQF